MDDAERYSRDLEQLLLDTQAKAEHARDLKLKAILARVKAVHLGPIRFLTLAQTKDGTPHSVSFSDGKRASAEIQTDPLPGDSIRGERPVP